LRIFEVWIHPLRKSVAPTQMSRRLNWIAFPIHGLFKEQLCLYFKRAVGHIDLSAAIRLLFYTEVGSKYQ